MSSKAELTRVVGSGGKRVKGAGVIGVLKCFKQKKVFSSVTTTRGRVSSVLGHANIYIVAVQWRFANARAEAAMASVNRVAGVNREIHLEIFDLGILVRVLRVSIQHGFGVGYFPLGNFGFSIWGFLTGIHFLLGMT